MVAGKDGDFSRFAKTQVERVSDRELLIQRSFRASAKTVFRAMTEPALLRRWWAPKLLGVVLFECESDARVGGRYRYVFGRPGEPPLAFSGTYTEVVPGTRLVYTQIFEPMPHAGEGLITAEFTESGGLTLLTQRERYPAKEVLDGALASGMERGMRETLEQLEALLAEVGDAA
ncbi:MAG TPA: SRPBCC family protein [Polyangiaceae bacterium]|nr:SRPBCC family protein [Polyangiaceae bacterium]